MRDVYVISSCRTAVGTFGGSLRDVPATELGSIVIAEALKRGNVKGEWLDEVMFGNVLSAAQGQNVARQCMVKAGVPLKVPAYTVSMVCGSGLKTVIEGSRAIQAGDADLVMCGGTESMSGAPYAIPAARWGARMGDIKAVDTMIRDGLWDAFNNYHMGTTAENICDIWGITREELDAFGYDSQMKALAAIKSGRFEDEIVPVTVKQKKTTFEFKVDEHPKDTTLEKMAKLKGAFPTSADGSIDKVEMTFEATHMTPSAENTGVQRVTAGNASGLNDGAAAIILASEDAVFLTQVSNVFGYVLPVAEAAALCRARGVPLAVDASQAAGVLPVELADWGARFVAMPGHKGLYGPQGTGLLLCGGEAEPVLLGGTGSASRLAEMPEFLPDRLEAGTHNVPGAAGLLEGLRFVRQKGGAALLRHETALKDLAAGELAKLPGVEVFHSAKHQSGVLSFRVAGRDVGEVADRLAQGGVAVRAGLHCAPLAHQSGGTGRTGTVRVSFSAFNTQKEVERFVRVLRQLV